MKNSHGEVTKGSLPPHIENGDPVVCRRHSFKVHSMWVPILIIILAVALVVGPVMWLSPSPRDTRLSRIRTRATALGMQVSWVSREALWGRPALPDGVEELVFYRLPWARQEQAATCDHWGLVKQNYRHERFIADYWLWQPGLAPPSNWPVLSDYLRALPAGMVACEARPQGVALGWRELGDLDQVEAVHGQLQRLRELCLEKARE